MSFFSSLFNKKDNENSPDKIVVSEKKLSPAERSELEKKVSLLTKQIEENKFDGTESNEFSKKKADTLDELGATYQQLGDIDNAIQSYEQSLKFNEDFGSAFDALQTLYNEKRTEASYSKDNDAIQKWLNKSDELNNLSKKIMRSK